MNFKVIVGALLNYSYNSIVTHIPFHFVRRLYLRVFNRKIHPSAIILMHTRILNFWKITIEEKVIINQYCLLDCRKHRISIANNTDIGPYTKIWTLGHKPDSVSHELYGGDVVIGHHVWIAAGVTILPSVVIGDGAVVAAASLVHKNVDANAIVGGNPARFLRLRHNPLSYEIKYNPFFE